MPASPSPSRIFGFAPPRTDSHSTAGAGPHHRHGGRDQDLHPAQGRLVRLLGRQHRDEGRTLPSTARGSHWPTCRRGDVAVWVGSGDANGSFDISGVPDGNYTLSWWDEPQNYNLNMINVTVSNGEIVDMGNLPLNGWWTRYDGYVFNDTNRNGVKNPGETGVPNFTLTLRRRENSLMDRGQTTVDDRRQRALLLRERLPARRSGPSWRPTTTPSTRPGSPTRPTTSRTRPRSRAPASTSACCRIIGLGGRMDWGVHAYDPTGANGIDPRNGGIVGSVSYDTTRNELDPQYAASEDWQPGVSDVPVELYATVDCGTNAGAPCDAERQPTSSLPTAPTPGASC